MSGAVFNSKKREGASDRRAEVNKAKSGSASPIEQSGRENLGKGSIDTKHTGSIRPAHVENR